MPEEINQKQAKEQLANMATKEFTDEIQALLKARSPLIYLIHNEERRLVQYFNLLGKAMGSKVYSWDCYRGFVNLTTMQQDLITSDDAKIPDIALDYIVKQANEESSQDEGTGGTIFLMLDFHRFIHEADPSTERRLKTLTRLDSMTTLIAAGPHYEKTASLDKDFNVVDFPYPNKNEIKIALYTIVDSVKSSLKGIEKSVKAREEQIIQSASGLSLSEATNAFAKSLVLHRDFNIDTILREKQQIIRKSGILEFIETNINIDDVGGLSVFTNWIKKRKVNFSQEAKEYGLKAPKGTIFFGNPGNGKSYSAKATANFLGMPLLKLDFGRMFGSFVGDSEKNIREALKLAEAMAPCILLLDEIDKGVGGNVSSSSEGDSGTTQRVIATLLTWLQDRTADVFCFCTANNHNLPAAFMRAGRFDEIFFVDVPSKIEREEIVKVIIRQNKRKPEDFNANDIAAKCDGYSGAEINKAIDGAMNEAFNDSKREMTTKDIIHQFTKFKPLSEISKDDYQELRDWANGRCVKANSPDEIVIGENKAKKIDLGA